MASVTRLELCAMGIAWLMCVGLASADSWLPAHDFEVKSSNAQYTARVVPKTEDRPAQLSVHEARGATSKLLWRADLSNETAPLGAVVSDDGQHVVTFDNWGGAGYGDDVLAFYDAGGQRKKYSLEQVLKSLDPLERGASPQFTASSRWWRQYNMTLLDQEDGKTSLCIWLGWARRWGAWDLATGEVVDRRAERIAQWNRSARDMALKDLGSKDLAAIKFLGWLKNPQDRDAVAKLLRISDFRCSCSSTRKGENGEYIADYFTAYSYTREAADNALGEMDGQPAVQGYVNLGTVHGSIRLPYVPKDDKGSIWVYLVPQEVPAEKWAATPPSHHATIRLSSYGSSIQRDTFGIHFEGVEPGRYWMKVVFDAAAPFCETVEKDGGVCTGAAGDYESGQGQSVEVKEGQVVEVPMAECTIKKN